MKKKVILRCLIGAPIGLSISFMITLIISVIINKGEYYPVVPQLTALCGNELNAVIIQAVCSLIYGCFRRSVCYLGSGKLEPFEANGYSLPCHLRINVADCLLYVLDAA